MSVLLFAFVCVDMCVCMRLSPIVSICIRACVRVYVCLLVRVYASDWAFLYNARVHVYWCVLVVSVRVGVIVCSSEHACVYMCV